MSPPSSKSDPPIRVMIVDDSAIIRDLLRRALTQVPEIEIVASVYNGIAAVAQVKQADPDIILLDVEMPEMDGLTALPQLLKLSPRSRVIMASTLTLRNAEISLRALELGASDYVPKPSSRDGEQVKQFYQELIRKIQGLVPRPIHASPDIAPAQLAEPKSHAVPSIVSTPPQYPTVAVRAIAIGSSTGGPQALAVIFTHLAVRFPSVPIFITQHMPPTFTAILAQHIHQLSGRPSAEAKEGEVVVPGTVYLAPGDYHMTPQKQDDKVIIRLNQNPLVNFCRPAVDPMLEALTQIYGRHLLVAILTGMGSDGLKGAREVVAAGGTVIAQNEQTSVVWGMPRAVTEHKLCSAVLPLEEIAPYINKVCP